MTTRVRDKCDRNERRDRDETASPWLYVWEGEGDDDEDGDEGEDGDDEEELTVRVVDMGSVDGFCSSMY